jgi:hypothetical protein
VSERTTQQLIEQAAGLAQDPDGLDLVVADLARKVLALEANRQSSPGSVAIAKGDFDGVIEILGEIQQRMSYGKKRTQISAAIKMLSTYSVEGR